MTRTPENSADWRPRRHDEQVCRDGFFDLKRLAYRLSLFMDRQAINDLKLIDDAELKPLAAKTMAAVEATRELLVAYSEQFPGHREGGWYTDRARPQMQRSWPQLDPQSGAQGRS